MFVSSLLARHKRTPDTSQLQRQMCVRKFSSEEFHVLHFEFLLQILNVNATDRFYLKVLCKDVLWIFCHQKLLFYKRRVKWKQYFSAANVCTEKNRWLDELKWLKLTSILHLKKQTKKLKCKNTCSMDKCFHLASQNKKKRVIVTHQEIFFFAVCIWKNVVNVKCHGYRHSALCSIFRASELIQHMSYPSRGRCV